MDHDRRQFKPLQSV